MTKWEYLRLYVRYSTSLDRDTGKAILIYSNGTVIFKDTKNPTLIHDYLNELGKDGWELVDVYNLPESDVFHFKRLLEF